MWEKKTTSQKFGSLKDLQMLKSFKTLISATLTIVFALGIFFTVGVNNAKADSLSIQTDVQVNTPFHKINTPARSYIDIISSPIISFTVGGRSCTLNGSEGNKAPQGCNYEITVRSSGRIEATNPSARQYGNCTAPENIASSCS